jgi:uncharacterized protein (DUF305 family)
MLKRRAILAVSFLVLSAAAAAVAQQKSPDEAAYMAAMEKMHKAMTQANDSDPAAAWAKKMIEHHRGAIEMSEIVLKSSNDPFITKQARKMSSDQQKEIRELENWLSKNDKK